jgi:hypothetical protein
MAVWRSRTLTSVLRSETILGWKCEEVKVPGKKYGVFQPIVTSDGKIRMADPIPTDKNGRNSKTR